ncbi:hypothetical protein E2C01_080110 [Portunus trituberculatus]|uniref:Uncharacterized protein n=1 Tax=Portunus trituberculatus TaxID=210409 RepID=A0A5B7ILA9_PORTR|nr:hypothetical protein [Portunus trituberculatus]
MWRVVMRCRNAGTAVVMCLAIKRIALIIRLIRSHTTCFNAFHHALHTATNRSLQHHTPHQSLLHLPFHTVTTQT